MITVELQTKCQTLSLISITPFDAMKIQKVSPISMTIIPKNDLKNHVQQKNTVNPYQLHKKNAI
jgi:protein subunit release factor B